MNVRKMLLAALLLLSSSLGFGEQARIPSSLRGEIKVDQETVAIAIEMQKEGWVYVMPRPKSNQARWGNSDGRTTWWVGYWHNKKTKQSSSTTPKLKGGLYVGNEEGSPGWRRGGSPRRPTKLEWLLSKSGGIPPRD